MHIPDGFINGATSLGAGVAAAGGLGAALRWSSRRLRDRQIPLAGLLAAFILVAQMINFPVAGGTSGHLLGGALAAVLAGPAVGAAVLSVVVMLQALLFADGGLSALGLNVVNMALVTTLAGWLAFRGAMFFLPHTRRAMAAAAFLAGLASVLAASSAFVAEYWWGGPGVVPIETVAVAMSGVHLLIGIGEGLITAGVVMAVMTARPDLVAAARSYDLAGRERRRTARVVLAGAVVALVAAWFVAPFASGDPDGLERVAADHGFAADAEVHDLAASPVAGYEPGTGSAPLDSGISGTVGIVAAFAATGMLLGGAALVVRRRAPV